MDSGSPKGKQAKSERPKAKPYDAFVQEALAAGAIAVKVFKNRATVRVPTSFHNLGDKTEAVLKVFAKHNGAIDPNHRSAGGEIMYRVLLPKPTADPPKGEPVVARTPMTGQEILPVAKPEPPEGPIPEPIPAVGPIGPIAEPTEPIPAGSIEGPLGLALPLASALPLDEPQDLEVIHHDPQWHVEQFFEARDEITRGVIEMAHRLYRAKRDLPQGTYIKVYLKTIGLHRRRASRMMSILRNKVLVDAQYRSKNSGL